MKRKHLIQVISAQMAAFILVAYGFTLDTITHRQMNETIATTTMGGFSLDSFLKNHLGIEQGVESRIQCVERDVHVHEITT